MFSSPREFEKINRIIKTNIEKLRKRRKARELDARMKEDAHELMVMRHAEANHPWDRMDRHDVIDPMANDVIY